MNKKLKAVIVLSFLFTTSFLVFIPTTSSAASPTSYVAITLTNSEGTATPKDFQQMLKVNWTKYQSSLNANVSNVRFYNSTTFTSANELSGWIETNNTTTATSSTVWLNLSNTIVPANGSVIIYMAFLSTTASWSSHWGLAPQLSTVYGKFDNGAKVFTNYWNFAGTSLPSTFSTLTTGGTFNYTVDNGLTLTGYSSSTASYALHVFTSIQYPPSVLEMDVNTASLQSGVSWELAYTTTAPSTSVSNSAGFVNAYRWDWTGGDFRLVKDVSGSGALIGTNYASSTNTGIMSLAFPSTGTELGYLNYANIDSGTDTSISYANANLDVALVSANTTSSSFNIYWLRTRNYPPGDAMPSVTFGSLTAVAVAGYQISFQQTSLSFGTEWGIRLNNTTKVVWQNSTTQYNNITSLSAGSYTFQVINATGYASNPYTGTLTIVSTNLTQSITFTGYKITYNETGLPTGSTWYVNLTDQHGLSESSTGQKLSGTTTSLTNYEPNGTYTFTYHTSDKKYSGGTTSFTVNGTSVTENVKFTEVLYYLNFTSLSKPKSVEWGVNVSGTVKTGYGNFSYQLANGTYYWNASAINGSFDIPLGYWRLTNESGTVLLHNESSFKGMKIVINGKNYNNNITFARAYNITYEEVGVANTFQWDVNLSNGLGTTLDKYIVVSDNVTQIYFNSTEGNYINDTYTGSIQLTIYGLTGIRYINLTASKSLSAVVNGSNIVFVYNFITQYYLTTKSVPASGGYHSPFSGWFNASSKVQLSATSNSSFTFTGFQGTNTSSYTGLGYYSSGQYIATITMTNPITEIMNFNNYIVLTFYMQNITTGTEWGVKLLQSSTLIQWDNGTGNYISFAIPTGTYTYFVTGVKSIPQTNTILVSSTERILLQFINTTYDVNFKELGLQPGTDWNIKISTSIFSSSISGTSILNFELPNGTYSYIAGSVYGYISNNSSGSFTVAGNPLLIYVNWTQGNAFILQGIHYFVPIYLNTSNFSVPSGSQIPINVNWNKYSKYENVNLSNVLFMNSSFYPVYAWIENNASSNFKNSTVWIKLNSVLPYKSSTIVYLVFQSKTRNNFNKYGYLGEASQLSKIFGEYDNIALIMNKGLITQIYTNTTLTTANITSNPILNAGYLKGTKIYDSEDFTAITGYYFTPFQGSNQEVYADFSVPYYYPYAQENNVVVSYQLILGDTGTFPSPPLENNTKSFLAKSQGFVVMDQSQTDWYIMDDDGRYLQISNGSAKQYLNSNWTSGPTLTDALGNPLQNTVFSTQTSLQGDYRMSFLYNQFTDEALWQYWTNYKVSYYSPSYIPDMSSLVNNTSFGSVLSSQNSFYEYGLPINTNWSIAISGSGISKLYTSNSNVIYTYLPNGTYVYTVGSMVNGSYHSGLVDVGTTHYVPNPSNGHVIVTGAFTVQYIIFAKNDLLEYDLIPGQAQYNNGSIILPIFVLNQNDQPANTTVIKNIWENMSLTYLARLQNQTETIPFTFSTSGLGMFAIFFSLNVVEVKQIKSSNATLSMVSDFSKTAYYTGIATGIAGSASFVDVVVNGQNISSVSPPGVTNTTTNTTGVPWYIGLIANTYPTYSPNALIYLENIVIWILANAGGRALTLIVGLATLLYFAWIINKARKDKGDKKWKFRVEKKLDVVYRKILREPIKQKSNNETSES